MAAFKCKMCGGTIEFEPGASIGVCDSCGTKQTLPRLDDDKRANLYDRANHFRRNNDFDKAMGIYEQILSEDADDAEAYWSLVLCRYGIEYVEDPATHKRVPTVNRAQYTSVFADADYKSAVAHADDAQRAIYEAEAKAIDEIQKGILEISGKEEPFDVFICYKETDASGRRTQDSVLANDLYHQLTQEGFKVFFARITLEDKLGSAYEPYIFAALNSAKVMVVLGTKPEYFNAVWVKNEWSRYLALVKQSGGKKMLIPAYKDMDPYDLPDEFSHLQAQDMAKLGFMQDLIRGIKKILAADSPKSAAKETVILNGNGSTAPLLKRVFLFLEDGNWAEADEYCEKVLDLDPECAEAYLGKLMAELHIKKRELLGEYTVPFEENANYAKVMRFGDQKLITLLKTSNASIKAKNELERQTVLYQKATAMMKAANVAEGYENAAKAFQEILDFEDAKAMSEKCLAEAENCVKEIAYRDGDYNLSCKTLPSLEKAMSCFEKASGWKDADKKLEECREKIAALKAEEERARIAAAKRAKILKKIILIGIAAVCVCIAFLVIRATVIIPNRKYNSAIKLYEVGKYSEAISAFEALNGYKDSAVQIENCYIKKYGEEKWEKFKNIKLSDTYTFGAYEQDNDASNGKEKIEWIVLDKSEMSLLLISKQALACRPYNISFTDVTWENCSLRIWMNGAFLDAAFSEEEQRQIISINVHPDKNPSYSTDPGNATTDKIFLLSINEVKKYFSDDKARRCAPTAYAKAQGAYTNSGYQIASGGATCWWWLRSSGSDQDRATLVDLDGDVYCDGSYVGDDEGSVRPAMWISLSDDEHASLENEAAAAESKENSINDAEQLATTVADADTSFKTNTAAIGSTTPANVYDIREGAQFDAAAINVGDSVLFGSYEQDANLNRDTPVPEPIEWLVLEKRESAVLVISRYVLEMGQYDEECRPVTWETSDIRNWLNDWFLKTAFTTYEISRIPTVQVLPDINPFFDTESGNATSDKIFLLSTNEVEQYFPNKDTRKCLPTEFVKATGGSLLNSWLLRSPGHYSEDSYSCAVCVNEEGLFDETGYGADIGWDGIRPALWITLNA